MTRHLFKLIWNRKRTNLLVMAEIFFSFLVLFGVITSGVYFLENYRQPLGFRYEDVWTIEVHRPEPTSNVSPEVAQGAAMETTRQLLAALREFPEVVALAGARIAPYSYSTQISGVPREGGGTIRYQGNAATDGFEDAVGLEVVKGRWFSREDDGATGFQPVVINLRLAQELFGGENPVGRNIPIKREEGKTTEKRVIGVVRDFRKDGELAAPVNYVFERMRLDRPGRPPNEIVVKVRPGTTAELEARLGARLREVARDWSFEVRPLVETRALRLKLGLAPLIAAGLVAGFLMLMVVLGLTGVLWQNVTQRTKEIGLRRAKGATVANIHRQILGELFVMTSLALALGVAVVLQFQLFELTPFVSAPVYMASLAISAVAIYCLTAVCGLYPSRLATRVQPAEALHYE